MFNNVYKGKKVLVTGHTGFKGAWLTTWLIKLGAKVIGISKEVPTKPSMFEVLELSEKITHYFSDIRELETLKVIIERERPDFVFHLAAQPIVSESYRNPIETIESNVLGTANLLEGLRLSGHKCTAIIVTSDKAYDNVEQVWGYKEDDRMGGKDIYSGSKGAAELIINSYFKSFFSNSECNIKLAIGRAGNVIGGGDWAKDRIVVDCMDAWSRGKKVEIRCPNATRPWQHVLEPLSGYLELGQAIHGSDRLNGEAFNFGPKAEQAATVQKLLIDLSAHWEFDSPSDAYQITDNIPFHEAGLLKLNCDKAQFYLGWTATLDYRETIRLTSEWYYEYYKGEKDIVEKTMEQIDEYCRFALNKGVSWME